MPPSLLLTHAILLACMLPATSFVPGVQAPWQGRAAPAPARTPAPQDAGAGGAPAREGGSGAAARAEGDAAAGAEGAASTGAEGNAAAGAEGDTLDEALARLGIDRGELGFRPRGDWVRFPHPDRIRFLLPCFESLFAEPLRVLPYTESLAEAVRRYLRADRLAGGKPVLYPLVLYLGVERVFTGFRGFGANLEIEPAAEHPLLAALAGLWPEGQDPPEDLASRVDAVPLPLRAPLARLVLVAADARAWRETAVRRIPAGVRAAVYDLRDLDDTLSDATAFPAALDDAAFYLDAASLDYAGQRLAQGAEDAARNLRAALAEHGDLDAAFFVDTPLGEVLLGGLGDDRHRVRRPFVQVDLGGNDVWEGPVGGTAGDALPVSVALDLGGNDTYTAGEDDASAQGAAVLGAAVLLDAGGNDTYTAVRLAQGAGLLGLGLLFDGGGDDRYRLQVSGQGAGYAGVGLLADLAGADRYYIFGDGQGYGSLGGAGVLADAGGDDRYTAEPDARVAGRGDYHSEHKVAASNAQGMGGGRRGDIADGHAWAGGLGALLDAEGDDLYVSGNWSQATGYWFGVGILWDGAGNDTYRSVYFTQASGAHFCVAALVDDGGDDVHETGQTAGAALAFGWDFAVAVLLDRGGNDRYRSRIISLGCAQIRSNALFLDLAGDDTYEFGADGLGLGGADWRERDAHRDPLAPYFYEASNLGIFLDLDGRDTYRTWKDPEAPWGTAGEDRAWIQHPPGSEGWRHRAYGIGLDTHGGHLNLDG